MCSLRGKPETAARKNAGRASFFPQRVYNERKLRCQATGLEKLRRAQMSGTGGTEP